MPLLRLYLDVSTLPPTAFTPTLDLLPASIHASITRYHFPTDRYLSLGSALLQRFIVCQHYAAHPTLRSVPLTRDPTTGRPYFPYAATSPLRSPSSLAIEDYNTSHHNPRLDSPHVDKCLVALAALTSTNPALARRIGVDVVPTRARASTDLLATFCDPAAAVFTASEVGAIVAGGGEREKVRRLYLLWALKEAYTKAVGTGIVTELQQIEFRAWEAWQGREGRWGGAEVWVGGVDRSSEWYLEVSFIPGRGGEGEGFYLAVCCERGGLKEGDMDGEWRKLDLVEDIVNPWGGAV